MFNLIKRIKPKRGMSLIFAAIFALTSIIGAVGTYGAEEPRADISVSSSFEAVEGEENCYEVSVDVDVEETFSNKNSNDRAWIYLVEPNPSSANIAYDKELLKVLVKKLFENGVTRLGIDCNFDSREIKDVTDIGYIIDKLHFNLAGPMSFNNQLQHAKYAIEDEDTNSNYTNILLFRNTELFSTNKINQDFVDYVSSKEIYGTFFSAETDLTKQLFANGSYVSASASDSAENVANAVANSALLQQDVYKDATVTENIGENFIFKEGSLTMDGENVDSSAYTYDENTNQLVIKLGDIKEAHKISYQVTANPDKLTSVTNGKNYLVVGDSTFSASKNASKDVNLDIKTLGKAPIYNARTVTIKYYQDQISDATNADGSYTYYLGSDTEHFINKSIGSTISKSEVPHKTTGINPTGYVADGTVYGDFDEDENFTVSLDPSENVIYVVYETLRKYPYEVLYYKDGISEENKLPCSISGEAVMGTEIPFDPDNFKDTIEQNAPEGYSNSIDDTSITFDVHYKGYVQPFDDDPTTEADESILYNSVKIVYTKKKYPYKIIYYHDSVDEKNKVNVTAYDKDDQLLQAYYNTEVPFSSVDKDAYLDKDELEGYNSGVIVGENENNKGLTITTNPEENVIRVLYTRANYPYTVNYYLEGEETPFKTVNDESEYGSEIPYSDKTSELGEDYEDILKGYEEDGDVTKYSEDGVITIDPEKNVIDVVFKLKEVEYQVIYYKEVLDPETKEIKIEKISDYGDKAKYGDVFSYDENASTIDSKIIVDKYLEHPGDGYIEEVTMLKAPETLGLTLAENTVKILYKLVVKNPEEEITPDDGELVPTDTVPEEVAADEGEVTADVPSEIAADEGVVTPEVAADTTVVTSDVSTERPNSGDTANIKVYLILAILMLVILCAGIGMAVIKKKQEK